ncbi:unnamed protein product, partial [marine sediment metagenome]
SGIANNKKSARQNAAEKMIEMLEDEDEFPAPVQKSYGFLSDPYRPFVGTIGVLPGSLNLSTEIPRGNPMEIPQANPMEIPLVKSNINEKPKVICTCYQGNRAAAQKFGETRVDQIVFAYQVFNLAGVFGLGYPLRLVPPDPEILAAAEKLGLRNKFE